MDEQQPGIARATTKDTAVDEQQPGIATATTKDTAEKDIFLKLKM